jgi:hypothetical protein
MTARRGWIKAEGKSVLELWLMNWFASLVPSGAKYIPGFIKLKDEATGLSETIKADCDALDFITAVTTGSEIPTFWLSRAPLRVCGGKPKFIARNWLQAVAVDTVGIGLFYALQCCYKLNFLAL